MKTLKYTLLLIGILGLAASIFNIIQEQAIYGNKAGLLSGIFLIFVSFNLKQLENGFRNYKIRSHN